MLQFKGLAVGERCAGFDCKSVSGITERYPQSKLQEPRRIFWPCRDWSGMLSSPRLRKPLDPMMPTPDPLLLSDAKRRNLPVTSLREIEHALHVGDLVFTRIPWSPFRQIAEATGTWTNHVGIVVKVGPAGAVVAEGRVPISRRTRFRRFVRRSGQRRVAVLRSARSLSPGEVRR